MTGLTHNGMALTRAFALTAMLVVATGGHAAAERIVLKDGTTMTVDNVRMDRDRILFSWKGLAASIAKRDVIRIEGRGRYRNSTRTPPPDPEAAPRHRGRDIIDATPGSGERPATDAAGRPAQTLANASRPPRPAAEHPSGTGSGQHPEPVGAVQLAMLLKSRGFADMQWGDRVDAHPELRRLHEDSGMAEVFEYVRPGETLRLGMDPRGFIKYAFWEKRLYAVTLWAVGADAYAAIRAAMFDRFGAGIQSPTDRQTFYWADDDADRMIEYLQEGQFGMLWMRSREINRRYKLTQLRIPISATRAVPSARPGQPVQD